MNRTEAIFNKLKAISDWKLWLIFFVYSLGISLLIQLVLLPYVFPQWHAGNGLIIGGDFAGFHIIAAEQAANVREFGWDEFTLYPQSQFVTGNRQFVSGIASIFYIFFFPSPVTILPLNAVLHAAAGLLCFKIIYKLTQEKIPSLIGASLFIIFPSALRWVSQMHNENYAVLGALMILYGWTQFDSFLKTKAVNVLLFAIGNIAVGLFLIGLVRDYLLQVYLAALIFFGLYLAVKTLLKIRRPTYWLDLGWFIFLFLFVYLISIFVYPPVLRYLQVGRWPATIDNPFFSDSVLQTELTSPEDIEGELTKDAWENSTFIPRVIDDKVHELIIGRQDAVGGWIRGSSGIDTDVDLNNSLEVLLYVPRALQIALLAPFPGDWFDEGTKAPSNFMRGVAALEMSFVYLLFLFLPYGLIKWRESTTLHLTLIYSLFFLTIYALATPNIGNLYRFRYPFFMLLVSLGAASMCHLILTRLKLEKAK